MSFVVYEEIHVAKALDMKALQCVVSQLRPCQVKGSKENSVVSRRAALREILTRKYRDVFPGVAVAECNAVANWPIYWCSNGPKRSKCPTLERS